MEAVMGYECLGRLMRSAQIRSLVAVSYFALTMTACLLLVLSFPALAEDTKPEPQAQGPQPGPQEEVSKTQTQAENTKVETRAEEKKPETRAIDPKTGEPFPEKFMIRGGWNYVFQADTSFQINGPRNLGGAVDFNRELGGQREDNLWRIDSLYRFNPRHSIGFSYYDVRRKGNRTVDRDLTIDDVTYTTGSSVESQLKFKLYRFLYNYSFHHDEKVELGLSGGLYFANIGATFRGSLTCTGGTSCGPGTTVSPNGTDSSFTVPLPTVGMFFNYNITPRLQGQARFDWFFLETAQIKASITEVYLGLEYRLLKHFSIGTAFDRLNIDGEINPKKGGGFSFKNDWNTLFVYGALYF
jgi:hypothetical protein